MGIRVVPDGQHEWSEALRREVDRLDTPGCLTVGSYLYDPMTPPFAGEQECDNHIAPWAATERHAVRW